MYNTKIEKLQSLLNEEDIDALAIVPGSNFLYLTGGNFHLMERPTILIISKQRQNNYYDFQATTRTSSTAVSPTWYEA